MFNPLTCSNVYNIVDLYFNMISYQHIFVTSNLGSWHVFSCNKIDQAAEKITRATRKALELLKARETPSPAIASAQTARHRKSRHFFWHTKNMKRNGGTSFMDWTWIEKTHWSRNTWCWHVEKLIGRMVLKISWWSSPVILIYGSCWTQTRKQKSWLHKNITVRCCVASVLILLVRPVNNNTATYIDTYLKQSKWEQKKHIWSSNIEVLAVQWFQLRMQLDCAFGWKSASQVRWNGCNL